MRKTMLLKHHGRCKQWKTSVTVNSKGLTQPFLDSLEEEGVKAAEKNNANEILFYWEW